MPARLGSTECKEKHGAAMCFISCGASALRFAARIDRMLNMMRSFSMTWVLAFLLALVFGSVVASEPTDPFARTVSTPEAEDMNGAVLDAMLVAIETYSARTDSGDTIDSVIVIRHGNVVFEAYPNPQYPVTRVHHLAARRNCAGFPCS
jgi:hypothetical protein